MFQQRYPPYDAHLTTFYSNHGGSLAVQDENDRRLSPVLEAAAWSYYYSSATDRPLPATAPTPANVPLDVLDVNYYGGISQETSADSTFLFTPTALGFRFNDDTQQYSVPTPHVVHTNEYVCAYPQEQAGDVPAPIVTQATEQPREQTSLPTPDSSPRIQVWVAEPPVRPFTKPPTEDAIREMIFRSSRDKDIGRDLFYLSLTLEDPSRAATGFKPPLTGIAAVDKASRQYYSITPADTELRRFGGEVCYQYPLEVIQTLQRTLAKDWANVMPPPIPIVILRPYDYIGGNFLAQGQDCWAFIVPSENTIWASVLERGVDKDYRPLATDPKTRQRLKVITECQQFGTAVYTPHSIVMSQFAVNLFIELPRLPNQGLAEPVVDYLGTFVMQYMDNIFMKRDAWNDIAEDIKNNLYDQAPHLFKGLKPYKNVPHVPVVKFIYTKFDGHLVGCADRALTEVQVAHAMAQLERKRAEGIESDGGSDLESDIEADSDGITGNDSLSFFDFDGE
ncbi:hypothetical protein PISMIDRAFT_16337 [Pisolithus microcarpus 441]|uniref:Uncharacterized protein n=1 Tax=Pisolithus microcarpus 441 TaxID=765257 RepID=A0A0C9YGC7_9AGAM|nr:hypothetical protein PISMIDRAFT_16337 [Pisolithus microcarpus 441]